MKLNPINLRVLENAEPKLYGELMRKIRIAVALRIRYTAPKGNRFAAGRGR